MGTKLFLKGERCSSPKCAVIRKPYPPGPKRKGRFKQLSEYGKELQEKQKLKNWYNLRERQFAKYVKDILKRRSKVEDASGTLIQKLEYRFDNVIEVLVESYEIIITSLLVSVMFCFFKKKLAKEAAAFSMFGGILGFIYFKIFPPVCGQVLYLPY